VRLAQLAIVLGVAVSLAVGAVGAAEGAPSASPPVNTALPTIAGTAQRNQTLTASSGSWTGTTPMTFSYQWLRCDSSGSDCQAVSHGGQTYTVAAADVGRTLRVQVTASSSDGQSSATSAATSRVADVNAPSNTARPTISGSAVQGQTLTASAGTWNDAASYSYRWQRCDANGNGCARISSGQRRTLGANDVGRRLRVEVTASGPGGSTTAFSDPTPTIATGRPVLSREPSVGGTAREGETLTADPGAWQNSPTRFRYQWQRCDSAGNHCTAVSGSSTRKATVADVGHTLRVQVTASNRYGSTVALSNASAVVASVGQGPASSSPPTITGSAQVGQTLTASPGSWSGTTPISFAYQWLRCDSPAVGCVGVGTAQTYTVQSADNGKVLQVVVTATNAAGSAKVASSTTSAVSTVTKLPSGGVSVDIAELSLPQRLVISQVSFQPSVVRSRVPFVARFRVTDSRGYAVRGALVYAVGLPYNRVAETAEVATGADGWATVTIAPTRLLPLRRGAALTMFVRARKPGEPLLAGISTRRLVQVRLGPPS